MKRFTPLCFALALALPGAVSGVTIVDDSWASGTRTSPPNDASWWASTTSSAIEVYPGELGLISGTSGRGIHGIFTAQSLGIGQTLTATFDFTTPATVGSAKSAAFRIGLFDTTGHLPGLEADISASSGSPNPVYNNLFGYMMDFDVNTGTEDISVRERSNPASGQLMAVTSDYTFLSGGGNSYSFAANTAYRGVMSITRTGADSVDITGELYQGATQLSAYTGSDSSGIVSDFGMIAFHVGSGTFGSTTTAGQGVDNGLTFSNIKIELLAVPEPSSAALLLGGLFVLGRSLRRRA